MCGAGPGPVPEKLEQAPSAIAAIVSVPSASLRMASPFIAAASAARERIPPLAERPQPQLVEPDEAFGVLLVVGALVVLEGDERRGVERGRARPAGDDNVALVQLEPHFALDQLLRLVDQRLEHLAFRREPEAVVDQFGIARHQLVLEMAGAAVERERLDGTVRLQQ